MESHREKLRTARRNMSPAERKAKVPPFLSKNWGIRVEKNKQKQANQGKKSKK